MTLHPPHSRKRPPSVLRAGFVLLDTIGVFSLAYVGLFACGLIHGWRSLGSGHFDPVMAAVLAVDGLLYAAIAFAYFKKHRRTRAEPMKRAKAHRTHHRRLHQRIAELEARISELESMVRV